MSRSADQLSLELRSEIRERYQRLRQSLKTFVPRAQQRQMVAEVARTFARSNGVVAIEAPTGTGKSLAYLLAGVPVALDQKKKLVIATATVALQEQLVGRDLPQFLQATGIEASVALAKGRQRYACTRNLHELGRDTSEIPQGGLEFGYEEVNAAWPRAPRQGEAELFKTLLQELQSKHWDGDLDRSPLPVDPETRILATTTAGGCSNRRCAFIASCPFVIARNRVQASDIIVANHDLVLADLGLGEKEDSGGVLLSAPRESLYVFDEAHHLPAKAIDSGAAEAPIQEAQRRLKKLAAPLRLVFQTTTKERIGKLTAAEIDILLEGATESLDRLTRELELSWAPNGPSDTSHWRAPLGQLPAAWQALAEELNQRYGTLVRWLPTAIKAALDADLQADRREQLARELGIARERIESHAAVWWLWAKSDSTDGPPRARWLSMSNERGLICHASEVSAAPTLRRILWNKAAGVVLTSATLSINGSFKNYASSVGLPDEASTLCLDSPFDLQRQASLEVPALNAAPDHEDHVREIANWLDTHLDWDKGNLVLFTSKAKMLACLAALPSERRSHVLEQGSRSKESLLQKHAALIAQGSGSTLFGLASFGEGLDLPGKLCETVVVTQLPFAVPTDPVEATYAEWLESRGRNAFVEVTLPQTTRTLIQYCGRLIRTEADSGRVVLLDNRVLHRRYGARMLAALPNFKRTIGT